MSKASLVEVFVLNLLIFSTDERFYYRFFFVFLTFFLILMHYRAEIVFLLFLCLLFLIFNYFNFFLREAFCCYSIYSENLYLIMVLVTFLQTNFFEKIFLWAGLVCLFLVLGSGVIFLHRFFFFFVCFLFTLRISFFPSFYFLFTFFTLFTFISIISAGCVFYFSSSFELFI